MSTPASLYILRKALYLSIETDKRHFFSAACCSAVSGAGPVRGAPGGGGGPAGIR